ncbi:Alpha-glucosidase [Cyphellophora attinorum]|uniref:Alpha-glucosidase n=1 Tax=Cyphellophora attinorum TaxID=1664694 RepID=A0A0N1NYX9_9EURO|nr:Alpha-glucosidase [Phialophora attinorum]KPI39957.1 Alpha-glucosidase [Phialophora attinorum]
MSAPTPNWWKTGTAYQVWPASYKDSNGDGIGDIQGLISTLPYLKKLGIDIVWLSPMYKSPQKDFGYDISDYQDVDPQFGTLADLDELIKKCHDMGMKLLLDLVINHTSDQHKWFLESKKDKTNEKADWYIWRDAKMVDGKRHPPNNWRSIFGGSAWEWVEERGQYYLHLFVPEQPDLNWELDEVRQAIYREAISFWLDRGVDGFRVDTCNLYSKNTSYPDAPIVLMGEEYQPAEAHFVNGPRMHEWLKEQREQVLDKYGDVAMVGELPGTDAAEVLKYVAAEVRELSCVFDFDVVSLGGRHGAGVKKHQVHKHDLPSFKQAIGKQQDLTRGTTAWSTAFLENHDQARSLNRFATADPKYREKAAKMLATLLGCLTGTLFIYQGQEIGMVNMPDSWGIEEIKDPDSLNAYHDVMHRHDGEPLWLEKAMAGIRRVARDNARTPVHWDSSKHGGFTTGEPWMRVHDLYPEINVADQEKNPSSPLNYWRKMIEIRQKYAELAVFGDFETWDFLEPDSFTFTKENKSNGYEKKKLLTFLSFSDEVQPLHFPPDCKGKEMELLISNVDEPGKHLTPWEARVYLVSL